MRLYAPITKIDAEQRMVYGYASSEALDDQGEIVKKDALAAALPEYMKLGNIREMHQLSAVGKAKQADIDEKGLFLGAKVVDPVAWEKVKEGVYSGFSIGGKVTRREAGNPKTITGLVLNEISLVDRPANPDAIFDCWKAGAMQTPEAESSAFNPPIQIWACGDESHRHIAKGDALKCMEKRAATGASDAQAEIDAALKAVESGEIVVAPSPPIPMAASQAPDTQVVVTPDVVAAVDGQTTSVPFDTTELLVAARKAVEAAEGLLTKDDGGDDMEAADKADDSSKGAFADPGYQSDGKKRYKLDTEKQVRAAWSYIHMPKNKKFYTAEQVSSIEAKIRSAGKKFNIKFSDDSGKAALGKSLWDIGEVAEIIGCLMSLEERSEIEAAMEDDDSSLPTKIASACAVLCQLLRDMVAEETAEVLDGTEIDAPVIAMSPMMMAAAIDTLRKTISDPQRAEALVNKFEKAGARHDAPHQAQLDTAAYALGKALSLNRASRKSIGKMVSARKAVLDAGAANVNADGREMLTDGNPTQGAGEATQHSTVDTGRNGQTSAPNPTGASPVAGYPPSPMGKAAGNLLASIEMVIRAGGDPRAIIDDEAQKAGGHEALCMAAHDLMGAASDGATCKAGTDKPGWLNRDDMESLHEAHSHLMEVDGVQCAAGAAPEASAEAPGAAEGQKAATTAEVAESSPGEPQKTAAVDGGDLAKALADERAEKATLTKMLAEVVPILAHMSKRVEDIANTPLPPALMARAPSSITKQGDNGPEGEDLSPTAIAAALAKMSKEDQSLTMIKAARANPLRFTDTGARSLNSVQLALA